jgi:TolA-binding protein
MTLNELWQDLIALIPVAGFAAAVVAAVVYVRYKGTIDALKDTVETYEKLAEGRKEESAQLRQEIADLEKKVSSLEQEMRGQAIAFEKLTEKFVDSLKYGVCIYSESCENFQSPSRSVK